VYIPILNPDSKVSYRFKMLPDTDDVLPKPFMQCTRAPPPVHNLLVSKLLNQDACGESQRKAGLPFPGRFVFCVIIALGGSESHEG